MKDTGKDDPSAEMMFSLIDPPIFAITARDGGRESAMIATWIMSATLRNDRSRLIATLSPENFTTELIRASKRFVVHLLAVGQHPLIPQLGLQSGRTSDKLRGLAGKRNERGLLILDGTCGYCECEVVEEMIVAERAVFVAGVVSQALDGDQDVLTLGKAYELLPESVVTACKAQQARHGRRDAPVVRRRSK